MNWTREGSSQESFPTFRKLAWWYLHELGRFPALVGQLSICAVLVVVFNLDVLIGALTGTDFLDKLGLGDFGFFFYLYSPGGMFSPLPFLSLFLISVSFNKLILVILPDRLHSSVKKLLAVSLVITLLSLWPAMFLTLVVIQLSM